MPWPILFCMEKLLEIAVLAVLNLFLFGYVRRKLVLQLLVTHQQLAVFKRAGKKPRVKERDRIFWMILSRTWPEWKAGLVIVKPETVLRWNRRRFKDYWRKRSARKTKIGRPQISQEHIEFIRRISTEHPEYGAKRIAGILKANFGVHYAKSTVDKYRVKPRSGPRGTQTWRTFLKNQGSAIWCCDFMVQYTFFFVPVYVFVVMGLSSRKIVHFGVTEAPSLSWVKQQIRHATPWGECPRFLIHDNDGIFGQHRVSVFNEKTRRRNTYRSSLDFWLKQNLGIQGIPIPYAAPNANAHCERCLETLRRECLDHVIILNRRHLHRTLAEFISWFNRARFHQGIDAIPDPYPELKAEKPKQGKLVSLPVLNGLHHDYRLAA